MLGRLFLGRNWCGNQNLLCFTALAHTTKNRSPRRPDDGPALLPYCSSIHGHAPVLYGPEGRTSRLPGHLTHSPKDGPELGAEFSSR
jgi:hypothetical protein